MDSPVWLLGTLGIVAMEASYVPQIVRLARLGHAEQLSAVFPALNLSGRLAAFSYSILVGQAVFGIGFFFGSIIRAVLLTQILVLKWRASNKRASDTRTKGRAESFDAAEVRA